MAVQIVLFIWLFNVLTTHTETISKYIDCIDVAGGNPGYTYTPSFDWASNATCPLGYYLTSCNAKTMDTNASSQGTYIDDSDNNVYCFASSPWSVNPQKRIRVYARCCNLTDYGNSYNYVWDSSGSTSANDAISTKACGSDGTLIGCGGWTEIDNHDGNANYFDGSYAESHTHIGNTSQAFDITFNKCITQNGPNGEDVAAEAQCYDTSKIDDGYELKCISVWSGRSDKPGGTHIASVSCPNSNYFMTSCSAFSDSAEIDSYYIENDICTVLDTRAGVNSNAYANAICCDMTKVVPDGPTLAPTQQPSFAPSNSNNPTKSPSFNPSVVPTKKPTLYPSLSPTLLTSFNPSLNPSISPTFISTNTPTLLPSFNPSSIPSISPINKDDLIVTPKPTTTSATIVMITEEGTLPSQNDDENITDSATNPYNIISYFALGIAVGCCVCLICGVCICCKRNKNQNYVIDIKNVPDKKRVMSKSIIKDQISNEKQNIILEMSNISKVASMSHEDEGTGTSPIIMNETPGSGNLIEDDTINTMSPGTIGNDGAFMNDVMNDEVITGSDEETPGTDDTEINDEQIMLCDENNQGMETMGSQENEVVIEGSFNYNGENGLMVGTPQ